MKSSKLNEKIFRAFIEGDYKQASDLLSGEYESLFQAYKQARKPEVKRRLVKRMNDDLGIILDADDSAIKSREQANEIQVELVRLSENVLREIDHGNFKNAFVLYDAFYNEMFERYKEEGELVLRQKIMSVLDLVLDDAMEIRQALGDN